MPPGTLPDLVAAQATRTPERVAVAWSGGAPWTYAELMRVADAVARTLVERGVERGEPVATCMPRTPHLVAGALGVLRSGAAYLPIDTAHPAERSRNMTCLAKVRHMLAWRTADMPESLARGMQVLELEQLAPHAASGVPLPAVHANDLACVLFTSGSTGTPKGVRILHRNLLNDLVSLQREPGVTADDVFGAFTTVAFDASLHELFLPLLVGGSLVMASETEQSDPAAARALLQRFPITLLEITPTRLRLMLAEDRLDELRHVKLWAGGEALPRDLADKVLPACRELWNTYGPTETTIESTIHRVVAATGPVPIGKPIANTTIHLLDASRAPVAAGETGEIWIGGAGVADGYLDDPVQTAERFKPDPFASDGSRMYRTGDVGRIVDGLVYFHGRVDDQIKMDGARIEPGDIEAAARTEPGVHEAVVVVRDLGEGDLRLVLYVLADADPALVTRLRAALRSRLPAYMQPRHIELLDALPRTSSGKIDRHALPPPRAWRASGASAAPAPRARADASTGEWSPLVPLQPHGTRPPLFLIHALDGHVEHYLPLARGLGANQPVYGIQAIGLDGLTPPVASLCTMAARYAQEIRLVQPQGPYFIAGAAEGGLIAWEVAQQLLDAGAVVALLGMIGTDVPASRESTADTTGRPPTPRHGSAIHRLRVALDAWRVRRCRAAGKPLPLPLRRRELEHTHLNALRNHAPRPYRGRIVLFRDMKSSSTMSPGWEVLVPGGVEVIELSGNHDNAIEHPDLLRRLRRVLRIAQGHSVQPGIVVKD